MACLALVPWCTQADTAHFTQRTADGVTVFSDTPLENGELIRQSYRSSTRPVVSANPCRGLTTSELDTRSSDLDREFAQAASLFSIDIALLKAVARAESCFDPQAISRAGARGLMQLMPRTARELGVTDIHDQTQNLHGGAKYLSQMLQRYAADTRKALAAYNAGPGAVDRYQGIPPFPETHRYIDTVLSFQKHYSGADTRL
jgi:soluble lytic murein transglycosylase-like protein